VLPHASDIAQGEQPLPETNAREQETRFPRRSTAALISGIEAQRECARSLRRFRKFRACAFLEVATGKAADALDLTAGPELATVTVIFLDSAWKHGAPKGRIGIG
jgi:hypothetical protein